MKERKEAERPARTQRLHIRLTPEEHKTITKLAAEHGLNISDWVRVTVIRTQPIITKARPERAALIRGLGELGKIGSNINQIAHELHKERIAGQGQRITGEVIEAALFGIRTLSDHLIQKLSGDP